MDEAQSGLTHEFFAAVLDSFKRHAEGRGYDITFINHNIGHGHSSYLEHCRYRGVDGVCVVCVNFLDPQVLELVQSELPVVTVDHMFNNRTSIVSDNVKGVQTLVNHVFGMGHRNIAFIHGERTAVTESRCASLLQDLLQPGAAGARRLCTRRRLPRLRQLRTHHRRAAGAAAAAHMHLFAPMTCRLWAASPPSPGRASACRKTSPPSVMTASLSPKVMIPSLTTYHQDTQAIGYWAADRLVSLIEHPKTTLPESILIPGSLLEGASVRRI